MNIPEKPQLDRANGTSQLSYGPNPPSENIGPWLDTENWRWYAWSESGYKIMELSEEGQRQLKAWEASLWTMTAYKRNGAKILFTIPAEAGAVKSTNLTKDNAMIMCCENGIWFSKPPYTKCRKLETFPFGV